MPVPTAEEAGFEPGDPGMVVDEHRSVCLYARRIFDQRRAAWDCFQRLSPSPPPPPPTTDGVAAAARIAALQQRVDNGEGGVASAPVEPDETTLSKEDEGYRAGVAEHIKKLALDNLALREVLHDALSDFESGGRRLMERRPRADLSLKSNYISGPLMAFGPIVGIELSACGVLCEAHRRSTSNGDDCQAYAFRRLDPADDTDLSVECHLLRDTGLCTPIDFAATFYSRRYESSRECTDPTPRSNPLCLEVAASRNDARVMDYDTSHRLCARGPGEKGVLPNPRSALEVLDAKRTPLYLPDPHVARVLRVCCACVGRR